MSTNMFNPSDKRFYPARWKTCRGKQLFQVIDEHSLDGNEELLSVSHITGITPRKQKNVTMFQSESLVGYKICRIGDIAANTMWTWQGAIGVSSYFGVISPAYNVYRQIENVYNSRYLDLLLRERKLIDVYHSLSTGIRPSRLRLYPEVFLTIDFPVPPREEQDQIVRFLDWKISEINRLINIKHQNIRTLKELMQAEIEKQLAAFDIVKTVRLKQIGTFYKGGGFSRDNLVDDTSCPAILYGDIYTQYDYKTSQITHYVDAEVYAASRKISKGDIVMAGTGETKDEIGKPILYTGEEIVAVGGDVIVFHPHDSVNAEYVLYQLYSHASLKHRYIHGKGDIIVHIYPTALGNTIIHLPSSEDQKKAIIAINNIIESVNQTISTLEQEISVLKEFSVRMVADVVTGKIDVRGIEIPEYEYTAEEADTDSEAEAEEFDEGGEEE